MSPGNRIWVLWFSFLIVPGSGLILADGIPFTSKFEFTLFLTSLIGLAFGPVRQQVTRIQLFASKISSNLLTSFFILAIFLKILSFSMLPLGNGFESCFQSIYNPDRSVTCEKSYDSPFIKDDNINGFGSLTRVEKQLNFYQTNGSDLTGASGTTWRLPFANDFPRLGALWLDRLPFTAKFGTVFDSEEGSYLPISYSGEIEVVMNGKSQASLLSYDHRRIYLAKTQDGLNKLELNYRFSDDNSIEVPDTQPPFKGPWAHLQVFEPVTRDFLESHREIHVKGWTFDQVNSITPLRIELETKSGDVLHSSELTDRTDVAYHFKNEALTRSGIDIRLDKNSLPPGEDEIRIFAVYENQRNLIGEFKFFRLESVLTPKISILNSTEQLSEIEVSQEISNEAISLLKGSAASQPNPLQSLLLLALNMFSIGIFFFVFFLFIKYLITDLRKFLIAVVYGLATLVIPLATNYSLRLISITGILFVLAIYFAFTQKQKFMTVSFLMLALVSSMQTMVPLTRKYMGIGSSDWWNCPLWRGRDSDWFVIQGYARQIFTHDSFRAGEGVFYFQPGARYLVFVQHLFFGDNDVLFAVAWQFALLTVISATGISLLKSSRSFPKLPVSIALCVLILTVFQQDISIFALSQASEFPTWIGIFFIFWVLLRDANSDGYLIWASTIAALLIQFRPNQAFGSFVLLLLLLLSIPGNSQFEKISTGIKMLIAFGIAASLSLLHNLHYAKTFQIFSSTGELNSDFKFLELLNAFNDSDMRNLFISKLRIGLNWNEFSIISPNTFHLMQLMWLVAVLSFLISRMRSIKMLVYLCLPCAYLIPLLPYRFDSYYPRHIVIIQFAFAIGAAGYSYELLKLREKRGLGL
jgi:hypothetical protein